MWRARRCGDFAMAEPLWQWQDLVAAAGGDGEGAAEASPPVITGVSIDTRTLAPGDLFVALKDARDGHDFVASAFAKGASAALVARHYTRQAGDGALIRVGDPLASLAAIGRAARARLAADARVVAVTGSAGKTGTKEMLRACLAGIGATHASEKSYNNHWGVPLTLARMPAATRFAVLEIGMNHPGEITPLTLMARPHVAIITNVLPVHLGQFASEEAIADAKAEILLGVAAGGAAILNADNRHFDRLAAVSRERGLRVVRFGRTEPAEALVLAITPSVDGSLVKAEIGGRSIVLTVGAPGEHLALNAVGAAAVLHELGVLSPKAVAPLASFTAPVGRGARTVLPAKPRPVLLIDESYNAIPESMKAALATMATVPRADHPRRIAVLGQMGELGTTSRALHLSLASAIGDAGVDLVFACGPDMRALFDGLSSERQGAWRDTSQELITPMLVAIEPGDVVMIKGSLSTNMAPLVEAVKKTYR